MSATDVRVIAVQERRRSGAAGTHGDRRTKRARSRAARNRQATARSAREE